MGQDTNSWQQDLAKRLEENQGKPVFEYSTTPQGAAKEVSKEENHHRSKWKRSELLLFITPLLLLCLLFVPLVLKEARMRYAPPTNPIIFAEWEGRTPAERIVAGKKNRAQERRNAILYEQYQRELAAWRLRFVVIPRMALSVLFTTGIVFLGIRLWRQYFPRLML